MSPFDLIIWRWFGILVAVMALDIARTFDLPIERRRNDLAWKMVLHSLLIADVGILWEKHSLVPEFLSIAFCVLLFARWLLNLRLRKTAA